MQTFQIPVDERAPKANIWTIQQHGRTFLFLGPNSEFLFTAVEAADLHAAIKIARNKWKLMREPRRSRWYGIGGFYAKFDWTTTQNKRND